MNKRKCLFLYTCFLNVKIRVQVHFTVALQFLRLRKCGIICTHFRTFTLWRKKAKLDRAEQ